VFNGANVWRARKSVLVRHVIKILPKDTESPAHNAQSEVAMTSASNSGARLAIKPEHSHEGQFDGFSTGYGVV